MENKQPTKEEIEKARADNVKKTLEWKLMQDSIGGFLVTKKPHEYSGKLGFQSAQATYNQAIHGEEGKKHKDELHRRNIEEYIKNGFPDTPDSPTDKDFTYDLWVQLHEVMKIAKIGELEKYAKELGADFGDLEIPENIKNYSEMDLIAKVTDKKKRVVNLGKLNEKEQVAYALCSKILPEYYKRACAQKASSKNYYADLNLQTKQLIEEYNKSKNK